MSNIKPIIKNRRALFRTRQLRPINNTSQIIAEALARNNLDRGIKMKGSRKALGEKKKKKKNRIRGQPHSNQARRTSRLKSRSARIATTLRVPSRMRIPGGGTRDRKMRAKRSSLKMQRRRRSFRPKKEKIKNREMI